MKLWKSFIGDPACAVDLLPEIGRLQHFAFTGFRVK
jgi:hypothetical protein